MKRVVDVFANPFWTVLAIGFGISLWAQAARNEPDDTIRYKMPHPASCHGCMAANLQTR